MIGFAAQHRRMLRVGTIGVVGMVLVGCRDDVRLDGPTAAMLSDPAQRHAISYASNTEALYVEVPDDSAGLSGNQATDVMRFLDRYRSESTGPLRITAPSSPRGHLAAARSYRQIETIIDRAGVPAEAVVRDRERRGGRDGLAVRLAYERPVAVPPSCGNWPEDLGRVDREKLPYESFGCATQRNLALTVANARDLQAPQEETPRSSERRSATWSSYIGSAAGGGAAGGAPAAPASSAANTTN
ncbi:MAG: CpaD family pilus assembly protein [Hyphomicrobiaceae bacterium]